MTPRELDVDDPAVAPRRGVAAATTQRTTAMASRREQRRARRRRVAMWTAVVGVVVLGATIATVATVMVTGTTASGRDAANPGSDELLVFPDDEPAAVAGAGPCIAVPVLSSFENAEMVENLAAGYNAQARDINGLCVTVTPTKDKSGSAAEAAAAGFSDRAPEARPTVWLPDAHTWISLARANSGEATVPEEATSIAASDIVLAMPEPLAKAIGWDEDPPTWRDVFDAAGDADLWSKLGHPEWGAFKLGKTSPVVATSGQAAMFASFGTAEGSLDEITAPAVADIAVKDIVREHELATSHYMATPEHFLWHAREAAQSGSAADFLSAVVVDEKSVWDYNRGITSRDGVTRTAGDPPAEKLVPIYPSDGFYAADNPAALLTGDWVDENERAAAADFIRYAGTAQGQRIARDSGYRDLNGAPDGDVAAVANLTHDPQTALPLPEQDVVAAINTAFPDVRKRAQVLFLLDVSASMDEPISTAATKLSAAKDAIALALDHFTAGDQVGLAAFTQDESGALTPGVVAPVADIGTSREAFLGALERLRAQTATPLYQAVDTFAAQQAKSWSPDRITAVVLLSDGENDTPNVATIGADQMLTNLEHLHHGGTPVLVFTLAYGADADVATLQSISSATGAHYYDATDPTKVKAVLGDLVTSF